VMFIGAVIGLIADFTARLTIFYTDFRPKCNNDIDLIKIPSVDRDRLSNAINELEIAIKEL
jgi:hypothetical protein